MGKTEDWRLADFLRSSVAVSCELGNIAWLSTKLVSRIVSAKAKLLRVLNLVLVHERAWCSCYEQIRFTQH